MHGDGANWKQHAVANGTTTRSTHRRQCQHWSHTRNCTPSQGHFDRHVSQVLSHIYAIYSFIYLNHRVETDMMSSFFDWRCTGDDELGRAKWPCMSWLEFYWFWIFKPSSTSFEVVIIAVVMMTIIHEIGDDKMMHVEGKQLLEERNDNNHQETVAKYIGSTE